jgi:hypothetical protein
MQHFGTAASMDVSEAVRPCTLHGLEASYEIIHDAASQYAVGMTVTIAQMLDSCRPESLVDGHGQ